MNLKIALSAAAIALGAFSAHAGTAALGFDQTTGSTLNNPPFTLGWDFRTTGSLQVDALGFFDDSLNGLADSHEVGLWNSSGTLLASATVAAGTVDPLTAQFRYVNIAPVTLAAGQTYYIGALFLDGNDNVVFPGTGGTVTTNPLIVYGQSTYADSSSTLTDPTIEFGQNGFFGPNFLLSAVPEPASWALMILGFGMIGAAVRRRPETATVRA